MNRFDRVTSIWLLLQTRSVVTAGFLAERFSVTERTVYRDIRTLENAGVPIGSEAGVGYFLEKGYRLPPVSFTRDEAAALLIGEKLLASGLDPEALRDYRHVLDKVRAVLERADKDHMSALDVDVEVVLPDRAAPVDDRSGERPDAGDGSVDDVLCLRDCRVALARRHVVDIDYAGPTSDEVTSRPIEPVGLLHYSLHWHLIAWCRLRGDYRDFRLDRIRAFRPRPERFTRHERGTLRQYLARRGEGGELLEVELLFDPDAARFVGEQRYAFGFVGEVRTEEGVRMSFLTGVPHYMARWLLQFAGGVRVVRGEGLEATLRTLSEELSAHWSGGIR